MTLPRHVALIMDGNTRWAQKHSLKAIEGHKRGLQSLRNVVEYSAKKGIKYLTTFAFSSENWARSDEEVAGLMDLFADSLEKESGQLAENNIAIRFIGNRNKLDNSIQQLMAEVEQQVQSSGVRMTLTLALDYGGRQDITNSCKTIAQLVQQGMYSLDDINESLVGKHVSLRDIPDPELCIRTSNEKRISNFLLWQMAYTELCFLPVLWPDFTAQHLDKALEEFAQRKRRYGRSSLAQ